MVLRSATKPPGRRTGAPKKRTYLAGAERRQQIVTATIAIISERGLREWKTAELALRVGLSEPALFRHFPNKGAILAAAVQQEVAALRQEVVAFQHPGNGWDRATGLIAAVLRFIESTGGGPLVILTGQLAGTSPDTLREVRGAMAVLQQRLTEEFAAAVTESRLQGRVAPADLADLAIAIIQSSALRWIMSDRAYPMQERAKAICSMMRGEFAPERHCPA